MTNIINLNHYYYSFIRFTGFLGKAYLGLT